MVNYRIFICGLLFCLAAVTASARTVVINAVDGETGEAVSWCSAAVTPGAYASVADSCGTIYFDIPDGKYTLKVVCLGYREATRSLPAAGPVALTVRLTPASKSLDEVVITARESTGLTSSSHIGRDAMAHLQPTSFTDLLELLPGNISKNPDMASANTISLRETGNISANGKESDNPDYAISSLGTLFVVDGVPVSTDANLQSVGTLADVTSPEGKRDITNRGVDMRSISTDNIESVDIVRGIPSAEYGNLTSGMVSIRRVKRAIPLTARFKADEFSKLFSAGKGLAFGGGDHVVNADVSYLDAKADPRNSLENYKRITASARLSSTFARPAFMTSWNLGLDYTGSVDRAKTDPDLSNNKVDEFKSTYNRLALNTDVTFTFPFLKLLRTVDARLSVSGQDDRLTRRRQVAPLRASIAPTSYDEGISEGRFLLGEYIADYLSEGRPVNLFAKVKAAGKATTGVVAHDYMAGGEFSLSKNFGRGQVYDLSRPLSASWTSRPRRYSDIPALDVLSFFAEDAVTVKAGDNRLDLQAGLRTQQLVGLDSRYLLSGKVYLDPRVNISWRMPLNVSGHTLALTFAAGYGLTTRMPTVDYLFPQQSYNDFIRLAYYNAADPVNGSLVSLHTYVDDATNYGLRAARNNKFEFRVGADFLGNNLSVTVFSEKMNSGFRYSQVYAPYAYRRYVLPEETSASRPDLDRLAYEDVRVLDGYRKVTNGSRIDKRGVEFQLTTARWRALGTSLIVSGAWFRTRYSNSQKLFAPVSDVIDNVAVSDRYVGLYDYDDGRVNSTFNTNFMFDTRISRAGLIFSTTLQCMWFVRTRLMKKNGVPTEYLSAADGLLHPYDPDAVEDPALGLLVRHYNDDSFRQQTIPTAMYLNFKATKTIGRYLRAAVFVNRLIDWLPSYKSNGLTVRRSSDTYFGMEITLTL